MDPLPEFSPQPVHYDCCCVENIVWSTILGNIVAGRHFADRRQLRNKFGMGMKMMPIVIRGGFAARNLWLWLLRQWLFPEVDYGSQKGNSRNYYLHYFHDNAMANSWQIERKRIQAEKTARKFSQGKADGSSCYN